MLSIGKLVSGAEDYYTGAGEAPGRWVGQGAERIGLSGAVVAGDLHTVLEGRDPSTGIDLTAGRVDKAKRVAGFDLTFSAPKSVSVLWGLGGETTATAVRDAHDRAVEEALGYLESHALFARRGAGGDERIPTTGIVAAAFRHRTSRSGDPQLHTHVLVANVCQGTDGRWSAPDARLLYFHGKAAGYLYQAALRAGLTERLGIVFGPVKKGGAEVEGVPGALVRAFSTRRQEIEAAMERHGGKSARAAEVAALDTRHKKEGPAGTDESLSDRWRAQARALGVEPDVLKDIVGSTAPEVTGPGAAAFQAVDDLTAALLGPEGLTAQASSFERRDVVRAVAERCRAGAHAADIDRAVDAVLDSPEVVALQGDGHGGEGRFTTEELLGIEARLISDALARRDAGAAVVPPEVLERALGDHPHLSEEQRRMVEQLATSGLGVEVVVGKAGAGKTTALAAARRAFEDAGYRVTGTALSARAAAGLEEGAGIPSVTLARLLSAEQPTDPSPLDRSTGHVLVVDEAGMVGTRDLARLLERESSAGTKVVLVGDHRQLPEIAAGGAFGGLAERLGAISLTDNRRQEEAWERATLDELRHGEVAKALAAYEDQGRVHAAPTMAEARRALVADWAEERGQHRSVQMLASTRADVDALNALARETLIERGLLGSVVAEAGGRDLALGDEVVCRRNDRRLGIVNGTRATVVAGAGPGGVTVATTDGLRYLPPEYLRAGHLEHGYATTVHLSQGETVERAFVLATESLYREAGYVALSRAKVRTDLYLPVGGMEHGRGPDAERETSTDLGRALRTSRAKRLATDDLGDRRSSSSEPEGRERARERELSVRDLGLSR